MATSYFKIGDHVVCEKSNVPGWEYSGKTGVIKKIDLKYEYPYYCVMDDGSDDSWCTVDCLVEDKSKEKIVITHDGKVTTATLYGKFGSKVTATARCAPEDTFDFLIGAEIAMGRLVDKLVYAKHNIILVKFREGERTYAYKTRIDTAKVGMKIVVPVGHHCKEVNATVAEIIPGAEYNGEYTISAMKEIDIVEAKYYNGKVVCIDDGGFTYDFTIGKIYQFVDGNCKNDSYGNILRNPARNFEDLSSRFRNVKFIPLVEDENKPMTIEELRKMDGQKVYCVRLDENAHETPDHSYCGWHTVNVKEAKLFDSDGKYWWIKSNGERYGYHAYRQAPLK